MNAREITIERRGQAVRGSFTFAYCMAFDRRANLARRGFYTGTNISAHQETFKGAVPPEDQISTQLCGSRCIESSRN